MHLFATTTTTTIGGEHQLSPPLQHSAPLNVNNTNINVNLQAAKNSSIINNLLLLDNNYVNKLTNIHHSTATAAAIATNLNLNSNSNLNATIIQTNSLSQLVSNNATLISQQQQHQHQHQQQLLTNNLVIQMIAKYFVQAFLVVVIVIYLTYFFVRVAKKPKLVGNCGSKFVALASKSLAEFTSKRFYPMLYFWGTSPQTALYGFMYGYTSLEQMPKEKFLRQYIEVSDIQYLLSNVDLSQHYENLRVDYTNNNNNNNNNNINININNNSDNNNETFCDIKCNNKAKVKSKSKHLSAAFKFKLSVSSSSVTKQKASVKATHNNKSNIKHQQRLKHLNNKQLLTYKCGNYANFADDAERASKRPRLMLAAADDSLFDCHQFRNNSVCFEPASGKHLLRRQQQQERARRLSTRKSPTNGNSQLSLTALTSTTNVNNSSSSNSNTTNNTSSSSSSNSSSCNNSSASNNGEKSPANSSPSSGCSRGTSTHSTIDLPNTNELNYEHKDNSLNNNHSSSLDSGLLATNSASSASVSSLNIDDSLTTSTSNSNSLSPSSKQRQQQQEHQHQQQHHHNQFEATNELCLCGCNKYEQYGDYSDSLKAIHQNKPPPATKSSNFGICAVDWFKDSHVNYHENKLVALVAAGLTTGSDRKYVTDTVSCLSRLGFEVCVFIRRGVGGLPLRTAKFFSLSKWRDIDTAIATIKQQRPNCRLVAVGFSFGSLELCRYLAMRGSNSQLSAALLISCPFDPVAGSRSLLESKLSRMIDGYLAKNLGELLYNSLFGVNTNCDETNNYNAQQREEAQQQQQQRQTNNYQNYYLQNQQQTINLNNYNSSNNNNNNIKLELPNSHLNFQNRLQIDELNAHRLMMLPKLKSLSEFEFCINSVIQNYPSPDAYGQDARLCGLLQNVSTPTLCLSSEDDPMSPVNSLPLKEIELNENMCMLLTKFGGHMAFVDGLLWPRKPYFGQRVIVKFFEALISDWRLKDSLSLTVDNN